MKTIGILGGMGPRATVMFEQLLVDRFFGSDQQVPTIITINDGSIPDRSEFLIANGPDPTARMQHNLRCLEAMGAEVIAIPCNTASMPRIFDRLESGAVLLNLPELVIAETKRLEVKRICLLATLGTLESETYQDLCREMGVECITLSTSARETTMKLIVAIKAGRMVVARNLARNVKRELVMLRCDSVILACTELSLVKQELIPSSLACFDTLEILADSCVELSKGVPVC
jgi:aspartate racemase